jgi:putative photosynthetic complex assembly protein
MSTKRAQSGLYFDAEQREMIRRDKELIPKKLVIAVAALALTALYIVSFSVIQNVPISGTPPAAEVVSARTVILKSDGVALRATDVDGTVITERDNGAFVSVVIDGLKRARKVARIQGNPPVTISRLANGRLVLDDPASGWSVELTSFGAGNAAYWNWILPN